MAESEISLDEAFSVNTKKRVVVIPSVEDVRAALQSFQSFDYVICIFLLLVYLGVGLYFGIFAAPATVQGYLVGDRKLKFFPAGISLTASFVTGILMISIPTETYLYGIGHIYLLIGIIAMALTVNFIYLPVFCRLNITSMYEFLERRFDKKVRVLGAILFIISTISWLPIVMYVPVLAFKQATGLNTHLIALAFCVISIFYTSLGGIRAVVWTDIIQFITVLSALILICIKGTFDNGSTDFVTKSALESTRIKNTYGGNNSSNITFTFWATIINGYFYYLYTSVLNQNMLQKYLSLPSLKSARRSSWLFTLALCIIYVMCTYCGFIIYAMFHQCDPLKTKLAREQYELFPLFASKILGGYPGLLGIFSAAILCASLSSWSTSLISITTVLFEDFYLFFYTRKFSEKQYSLFMKITVITIGLICICWIYAIDNVKLAMQISTNIGSVFSGPSLGLLTMGVILPWTNSKGAFIGAITSLLATTWICCSSFVFVSMKPLTTENCHYHFLPDSREYSEVFTKTSTMYNPSGVSGGQKQFYPNPFLWHTLIGTLITLGVGLLVSFLSGPTDPRDIDPRLLAPFLKRVIKPRDFPNEPMDTIIYAFDTKKTTPTLHSKSSQVGST